MAHPDPQELQRFADGELGRSRRAKRVESHLRECEDCAAEAERVKQVGYLLREATDEAAATADLDGVADAVLDRIRQQPAPLPPGERLRTWLGEFLRYRRKVWVPSLAAAGAATAALLVALSVSSVPPQPAIDLPPGSNVLSVSFGSTVDGALFQLEGKDGSTTAIIWVDEGDAETDPEVKST